MNSDIINIEMENELNPYKIRNVLVDNINGMPIQEMCRLKRAYEGLTQRQLGEIIGCSTSEISKFEKGKKQLSPRYFSSLERYLFNTRYRKDEDGDYEYYDYDWTN
ncbi:helix-turn-helix domain-containing protein [Virgibacillus salexigens]|uniref:helix-turn-helix domain-containing protein n=1 Tax=Virgibacillus salexigens TaxID=61016 RepID=UPI0019091296|nr:helix-turn-helix transcriptional regulator [Virgibacillus salexigens]